CSTGQRQRPFRRGTASAEAALELGVGLAHVGFSVEGLEGELVAVVDAAAGVGGGELVVREAALILALLAPDGQDAVRDETAVGVVMVAVAVVAIQHRELGTVDGA